MINKTLTKKFIAALIFTNVCLVLLYAFLFYKVDAYEEGAAVIYSEIGATEEGEAAYRALKESVENTALLREKLEVHLVSEDETVVFIEQVEGLATSTGTNVHLVAVTKETTEDSEFLKLSVEALGSFSEVYHFLSLLETLPYKVLIDSAFLKEGLEGLDVGSFASGETIDPEAVVSNSPENAEEEEGGVVPVVETADPDVWQASVIFRLESFTSSQKNSV